MVPYIIGGVLVLIVGGVAAYYIMRFMKGRLKLELSRNAAGSGETLAGHIELEAKQSIHGLLKVSLVGREKRRKRSMNDDNDSTEWVEVYRQDMILEETRDFEPGYSQEYGFEITAPTKAEARTGGSALKAMADSMGDGMLSGVMKAAAGAADMMQGRIHWHVEAHLDAKGIDLFTKKSCRVNLRD